MIFQKLFQKKQNVSQLTTNKKKVFRSFAGARNSALARFSASYSRINAELKSDYIALTLRARDLAKNNQMVNSYINLMIRNVIGDHGFILNSTVYNDDGTADIVANGILQKAWYQYSTSFKKYVDSAQQLNDIDLDKQILFILLTDGEVFIRKIKDAKSKFGIRFEIVDSLDIDTLYNVNFPASNEKICMGIKVDKHNKPLKYYVRKAKNTDYYLQGQREEIDASEVIHIYRKYYAGQIRGFTPLSAVIQALNGLQQYKTAEINASLLNSCFMGVWQKTGTSTNNYENYDQSDIDASGDVALQLESNVFRYAPEGYTLQQIASNHPNSNLGAFFKACIKGIASALGVSSNKLNSDYESVNYSSLRQANQQDIASWRQLQRFFIDNWKNIQYAEWLRYLLLSDLTNLPYSKIDKFLCHEFRAKNWEYLDPQKQYTSIKMQLEMKLTNPIIEIEKKGLDVDDVLNGWQIWEKKLKERNITVASDSVAWILSGTADDTENEKEKQE